MIVSIIFPLDTTSISSPIGVDLQAMVDVLYPGKTISVAVCASIQKMTDTKSLVIMNATLT